MVGECSRISGGSGMLAILEKQPAWNAGPNAQKGLYSGLRVNRDVNPVDWDAYVS